MKNSIIASAVAFVLMGCGGGSSDATETIEPIQPTVTTTETTKPDVVIPAQPEFSLREIQIAELLGYKQPDDIKTLCRSELVSCTVVADENTGEKGVYFKGSLTKGSAKGASYMYFWPLNKNNEDELIQTEFFFESDKVITSTDQLAAVCALGFSATFKDRECRSSTDKNGTHRFVGSYSPYYDFFADIETSEYYKIFAVTSYEINGLIVDGNSRMSHLDGSKDTEAFNILIDIMKTSSEGTSKSEVL